MNPYVRQWTAHAAFALLLALSLAWVALWFQRSGEPRALIEQTVARHPDLLAQRLGLPPHTGDQAVAGDCLQLGYTQLDWARHDYYGCQAKLTGTREGVVPVLVRVTAEPAHTAYVPTAKAQAASPPCEGIGDCIGAAMRNPNNYKPLEQQEKEGWVHKERLPAKTHASVVAAGHLNAYETQALKTTLRPASSRLMAAAFLTLALAGFALVVALCNLFGVAATQAGMEAARRDADRPGLVIVRYNPVNFSASAMPLPTIPLFLVFYLAAGVGAWFGWDALYGWLAGLQHASFGLATMGDGWFEKACHVLTTGIVVLTAMQATALLYLAIGFGMIGGGIYWAYRWLAG